MFESVVTIYCQQNANNREHGARPHPEIEIQKPRQLSPLGSALPKMSIVPDRIQDRRLEQL